MSRLALTSAPGFLASDLIIEVKELNVLMHRVLINNTPTDMQFAKSQTSEVIVTFKNMITQALSVSIRWAGPVCVSARHLKELTVTTD